jgi:hypothetical protein
LVERAGRPPKHQGIKKVLGHLRLDFLWVPVKAYLTGLRVRVMPGIQREVKRNDERTVSSVSLSEAWSFLLGKIISEVNVPLSFVYCPEIPRPSNGTIEWIDENGSLAEIFYKECARNGIGFINMGKEFCKFFERTGKFPRGFWNSRPGEGHLNEAGHKLVAQAIYNQYISMKCAVK